MPSLKHAGLYGLIACAAIAIVAAYAAILQHGNPPASEPSETARCSHTMRWGEGKVRKFTLKTVSGQRVYYVHLPYGYSTSQKYPLIMAFTGKNMSIKYLEKVSGLNNLPAIIVYPQAYKNSKGVYAWQGAPYSPAVDDIDFVNKTLNAVDQDLCVEADRVYSIGISNGGGMSWLVSCQLSDKFAAFVMLSGAFYYPESRCNPTRPTPILNIHGTLDKVVPYQGSRFRHLPHVDDWIKQRARKNHCVDPHPQVAYYEPATKVTIWSDCEDDAEVENVELFLSHHEWPTDVGSPLDISDGTEWPLESQTKIKTTSYIWDFLSDYTLHK